VTRLDLLADMVGAGVVIPSGAPAEGEVSVVVSLASLSPPAVGAAQSVTAMPLRTLSSPQGWPRPGWRSAARFGIGRPQLWRARKPSGQLPGSRGEHNQRPAAFEPAVDRRGRGRGFSGAVEVFYDWRTAINDPSQCASSLQAASSRRNEPGHHPARRRWQSPGGGRFEHGGGVKARG
jgi:hypothetical protein